MSIPKETLEQLATEIARHQHEIRATADTNIDAAEEQEKKIDAKRQELQRQDQRSEGASREEILETLKRELKPMLRSLPLSDAEDAKAPGGAISREKFQRLMTTKTSDPVVQRAQRVAGDLYIAKKLAQRSNKLEGRLPEALLNEWEDARGEMMGTRATTFGSTGSGTGDEWTFDMPSAELIEFVSVLGDLEAQFPRVTIPQSAETLTLPRVDGRGTVYTVSQTETDTTTQPITVSNVSTAQVVHSVGKHASRFYVSREATEDQIVATIPVLREQMAENFREALEEAIISGDTGSNLDSDMAAGDNLDIFNGLREIAINTKTAATKDMSSDLDPSDAAELLALMGKYAAMPDRLRMILSLKGYYKWLKNAEFTTVDKIGNAATLITGQVGAVLGIPVLKSGQFRSDLNASGVFDNTTTSKHAYLIVNTREFTVNVKRDIDIRVGEELRMEYDQLVVVGHRRVGFTDRRAAGDETVAYGYNLAN